MAKRKHTEKVASVLERQIRSRAKLRGRVIQRISFHRDGWVLLRFSDDTYAVLSGGKDYEGYGPSQTALVTWELGADTLVTFGLLSKGDFADEVKLHNDVLEFWTRKSEIVYLEKLARKFPKVARTLVKKLDQEKGDK